MSYSSVKIAIINEALHRMNVAITRAKELLIVVGNANLLARDPYWKAFLQFTLRNHLYVFSNLFFVRGLSNDVFIDTWDLV